MAYGEEEEVAYGEEDMEMVEGEEYDEAQMEALRAAGRMGERQEGDEEDMGEELVYGEEAYGEEEEMYEP